MHTQALILAELAALHNFIRQYDPKEIRMFDNDSESDSDSNSDNPNPDDIKLPEFWRDHPETVGELWMGAVTAREMAWANMRWDRIVGKMWEQY